MESGAIKFFDLKKSVRNGNDNLKVTIESEHN